MRPATLDVKWAGAVRPRTAAAISLRALSGAHRPAGEPSHRGQHAADAERNRESYKYSETGIAVTPA